MRIDELLAAGPTRSFEFFPPKSDEESAILAASLEDIKPLAPSFVSVTYRGGRESRQRTYDLVTQIERDGYVTAMAHVICVGHSRAEMRDLLKNYADAGVSNIMALGGDIPSDPMAAHSEFEHAIDLIDVAAQDRRLLDRRRGPSGRPPKVDGPRLGPALSRREAGPVRLRRHPVLLRVRRMDARLVAQLAELGVAKPVLPGIMPVTTITGIERMETMGAAVPQVLVERLVAADERRRE